MPASRWADLLAVRDILTEWLLRPASAPGRIGVGPEVSVIARLGLRAIGAAMVDGTAELTLFLLKQVTPAEDQDIRSHLAGLQARNITLRSEGGISLRNITLRSEGGISFQTASRPVRGGESVGLGVANGGSGTLGCRVRRSDPPNALLGLSCNHVIADLNAALRGSTEVWAPGSKRGGTSVHRLGVVDDFADIDFTPGAYNVLDAALVRPDSAGDIDTAIAGLGTPSGANRSLSFGDRVRKSGDASGVTNGKYRYAINASIEYEGGKQALFKDMLGIVGAGAGNFAAQGDSGAVLLDHADAVSGMVISVATGIDLTLATPIGPILDHFQVDIS